MLTSSMLWLTYHNIIGSMSGMMNEVFTQLILITTIYRLAHPMGGTKYYTQKVRDILWKRRQVDYDRFIFLHDRITHYRHRL